jgi:WD40 repeat protein
MDGKAWLWDLAGSGTPPRLLADEATAIACASGLGPVGLVIALRDGKLQDFGADGGSLATIDGPGGIVAGRALATDGRSVVAGSDTGTLLAWDAETRAVKLRRLFGDTIAAVGLSASGELAVGCGDALHRLSLDDPLRERPPLKLDDPAGEVAFSADGRWLACATRRGRVRAWRVDEAAVRLPLEGIDSEGETTALAFAPDGRTLVAGGRDGGTRSWRLPDGERLPGIAARRGQVVDLGVSADARHLLQVTRDGRAQVWDLREGRALGVIEGSWASGVLTPDGSVAVLADRESGEVVACDRATGRRRPTHFARPDAATKIGKLALSGDGRWLAGAGGASGMAWIWEAATGRLVATIRGHEGPTRLSSLVFGADPRRLLTTAEDGTAIVWEWDPSTPEAPARRAHDFRLADGSEDEPVPITAAGLAPTADVRVAAGGIDGRVVLWSSEGKSETRLGEIEGAVSALTFTGDGKWLAVAGVDKSIWLFAADGPRRRARLEPSPQHDERVNVLLPWPGGRMIASGSDDTTVRLWDVEGRSLLGTLSADQASTDWVAYTPDGLFDTSMAGDGQLAWLDGRDLLSLDQVAGAQHVFRLTDEIRRGRRPKPPELPHAPPPRLSIDEPRTSPNRPAAELTIATGEAALADLRLYQNGVPIQAEGDLTRDPSGRRFTARVPLRRGLNRFYAMASRPGSGGVEGRSEVVEIQYGGPDTPGRMHVLALGVSHYRPESRALQFADRDARAIADFLGRAAASEGQARGLEIVLLNEEVTPEAVEEALGKIRDEVRGRPQDTVVVFLAGHADVADERFRLLLSPFPFREDGAAVAKEAEGATLPYASIYRNLVRLGALQRLVVIDACEAGAVVDDPGVRMIQRLVDAGSRRAKTAYLLAARRGEPTGEVSALNHGLLTYAMLRGMAAPGLEPVPGLTALDEQPDADSDHDGVITTDELRDYTDWAVGRLSSAFPVLAMRQGPEARGSNPKANLDQHPRIEASDASFPLVILRRRPAP